MANLSALVNATISVTDTTLTPNATIVTRNLNNPTLAATEALYIPFLQVGTSDVSVPFPGTGATIWLLYVKNLGSSGAGNLSLSITPVGQSAQFTPLINPGGFFLSMMVIETSGGIIAATLVASAGTVPCEVITAY